MALQLAFLRVALLGGDDAAEVLGPVIGRFAPVMDGDCDGLAAVLDLFVIAVVGLHAVDVGTGEIPGVQRLAVHAGERLLFAIPVQLDRRGVRHIGGDGVCLVRQDHRFAGGDGGVVVEAGPEAEAQSLVVIARLVRHAFRTDGSHFHAIITVFLQAGDGQLNTLCIFLHPRTLAIVAGLVVFVPSAEYPHEEEVNAAAIRFRRQLNAHGQVFALAGFGITKGNGEIGNRPGGHEGDLDGVAVLPVAVFFSAAADGKTAGLGGLQGTGKPVFGGLHRHPAVAHIDLGFIVALAGQVESDLRVHRHIGGILGLAGQLQRLLQLGHQPEPLVRLVGFIARRGNSDIDREGIVQRVALEPIGRHGELLAVLAQLVGRDPDVGFVVVQKAQAFPILVVQPDPVVRAILHPFHGEFENLVFNQVVAADRRLGQRLALAHRHLYTGLVEHHPSVVVIIVHGELEGVITTLPGVPVIGKVIVIPLFLLLVVEEQGYAVRVGDIAVDGQVLLGGDVRLAGGQGALGVFVGLDHFEDQRLVVFGFGIVIAHQSLRVDGQTVALMFIQVGRGQRGGCGVAGQLQGGPVHEIRELPFVILGIEIHPQLAHACAIVLTAGVRQTDANLQVLLAGDLAVIVEPGGDLHHGLVYPADRNNLNLNRVAVDPDVVLGLGVPVLDMEMGAHQQVAGVGAVLRFKPAGQPVSVEVRPAANVLADGNALPFAVPANLNLIGHDHRIWYGIRLVHRKGDPIGLAGVHLHGGLVFPVHRHGQGGHSGFAGVAHCGKADLRIGVRITLLPDQGVNDVGMALEQVVAGNPIAAVHALTATESAVVVLVVDEHINISIRRPFLVNHKAQVAPCGVRGRQRVAIRRKDRRRDEVVPGQDINRQRERLLLAAAILIGHGLPVIVDPLQQPEGIGAGIAGGEGLDLVVAVRLPGILPVLLVGRLNPEPVRAGHIGAQHGILVGIDLKLVRAERRAAGDHVEAQLQIVAVGVDAVVADLRLHPDIHAVLPVLGQVAAGQQDGAVGRRIDLEEALVIMILHIADVDVIVPGALRRIFEHHAQLLATGQAARLFIQASQADIGQGEIVAGDIHRDRFAVAPTPFFAFILLHPCAHLEVVGAAFTGIGEGNVGEVIVEFVEGPVFVVFLSEDSPSVVPQELHILVILVAFAVDLDIEGQVLLGLNLVQAAALGGRHREDNLSLRFFIDHQQLAAVTAKVIVSLGGAQFDAEPVADVHPGIAYGMLVIVGQRHTDGVLAGFLSVARFIGDGCAVIEFMPMIIIPKVIVSVKVGAVLAKQVHILGIIVNVDIVPGIQVALFIRELIKRELKNVFRGGNGVAHLDLGIGQGVFCGDGHGDGHALQRVPVHIIEAFLPLAEGEAVLVLFAAAHVNVRAFAVIEDFPFRDLVVVVILNDGVVL